MNSRVKEILVGVLAATLVAVLVVGVLVWTNQPKPAPVAPQHSVNIRDAVATENLLKHLDALQKIADENAGNRASGTPGYAASLDYVEGQLKLAGYTTVRQEFTFQDGSKPVTTWNLLADTAGNADQTIVVGAHLDGVTQGPGINDNGSGVAAVLETAVQFGRLGVQPTNRVRFAFWGAEEDGLFGSFEYVAREKQAGRTDALYLNLDMVGSPNPVPYVYSDNDWPEGSAAIEKVLEDFFEAEDITPEPISFEGSDHLPFVQAGIPIGGLHTGSSEKMTKGEAEQYGGEAGEPLDPCYHESCDRLDAIDHTMLGVMADAVAHATLTFAQASEPIR